MYYRYTFVQEDGKRFPSYLRRRRNLGARLLVVPLHLAVASVSYTHNQAQDTVNMRYSPTDFAPPLLATNAIYY